MTLLFASNSNSFDFNFLYEVIFNTLNIEIFSGRHDSTSAVSTSQDSIFPQKP